MGRNLDRSRREAQQREQRSRQRARLQEQVAGNHLEGQFLKREVKRREQLERHLRASNAQLERANEELASFGYAISHDLVAPLRRCRLLLGFLEDDQDPPLNEAAGEHLAAAIKMTEQLSAMVQGVLECSRAGADTIRRNVSLGKVLEEAVGNLAVLIAESQAVIEVGDLPEVSGNHARLVQLFQNLLQNAIRYRAERPLRIEVAARQFEIESNENGWSIEVKDNGVGIKQGAFRDVFRLFSRMHQDSEGAGIGLSICKRVVEAHGGQIEVESEVGVGSTFRVILPKSPKERLAAEVRCTTAWASRSRTPWPPGLS